MMWALLLCIVLGCTGAMSIFFGLRRTARDVATDLLEGDGSADSEVMPPSPKERLPDRSASSVPGSIQAMFVGGSLALLPATVLSHSAIRVIALTGIGGGLGYLWSISRGRALVERRRDAIAFHLPLVMESVVMAVEAGADVLSAIRRVVDLTASTGDPSGSDPVTQLLRDIVERIDTGAGLEETLRAVAAQSDVVAIRHAFLHLALAHREGGELIRPLRELGSSTQVHFQEAIEERIAKLPVKATAPLLCTFAGLIICFVTIPLLQVSSMTKRTLPADPSPPRAGERGAMTLFLACCIIPILFMLGTLALDLRAYTVESGARQRILDEAALEGVRGLPDPDAATQVAERYLARFGFGDEVDVQATSRTISLLHEGMKPLSFPRIFGLEAEVPISLYARARSRPVDAIIALDLSRGLSPREGTQWGSESEWGAAAYFVERAGRYQAALDARALTARCFNPTVSALKLSAIRAFEYLDAFGDGRIGVGIFPGAGYDFQFIRRFGERNVGVVEFPRYEGRELRSEDCAGAAEEEHWISRYRFPMNRYEQRVTPAEPFLSPGGEFNQAYAPYLTIGEAIWSSPVREYSPDDSGIGDLSAVIDGALGALVGAPALVERGALGENPRRLGLIFTGDLPRVGAERFPSPVVLERIDAVLNRYRAVLHDQSVHIQIVLVILTPRDTFVDPFERRGVHEFFSSRQVETGTSSIKIDALFPESEEELLSTVVPNVLLDRSGGGIAR